MKIHKMNSVQKTRAEGDIVVLGEHFPYDTEIYNAGGVSVVIWLGNNNLTLAEKVVQLLCNNRDVVQVYACPGLPVGYWAHFDVGE